jgi:hypothetical protein
MASERTRPRAPPFIDPPGYVRHRPEATLLYEVVERHYLELVAAREAAGRPLPTVPDRRDMAPASEFLPLPR